MDAVALTQTEGHCVQTGHGVHGVGVIAVGQDAALGGSGELAEGCLDGSQILEVVQMVLLNVQHHSQGGEEIQEGVAVLAALHDNGVALAHTVASAQQGQVAADHNGGIGLGLHHDVGDHGGGSGLAVGAGDADGILVCLHDLTPCLGALEDGDAGGTGSGDLGVVVVGGGGADDAVSAFDVLRLMTDADGDALVDQLLGGGGSGHVRAGDGDAHALQDEAQRTHGDTADADQMDTAAGSNILCNRNRIRH